MQSKYSDDFKKYTLENDGILKYRQQSRDLKKYLAWSQDENGVIMTYATDTFLKKKKEMLKDDVLNCAQTLIISRNKKTQKVKHKISQLVLTNKAVFVTLTFNNETLESTSRETRRRYVARFLKENSKRYVANIDFGGDYGREHYHAIVDGRLDVKRWAYGFSDAKKIRCKSSDTERVAKYITKLTYHAIKKTTTQQRLIYSRNV